MISRGTSHSFTSLEGVKMWLVLRLVNNQAVVFLFFVVFFCLAISIFGRLKVWNKQSRGRRPNLTWLYPVQDACGIRQGRCELCVELCVEFRTAGRSKLTGSLIRPNGGGLRTRLLVSGWCTQLSAHTHTLGWHSTWYHCSSQGGVTPIDSIVTVGSRWSTCILRKRWSRYTFFRILR